MTLSPSPEGGWRAVYALGFGVFALITAEFLPMSLLTPMASSLHVTEGLAGQAVTATAICALLAGLFIATLTRKLDRRIVLLGFAAAQVISSLLVATSNGFAMLLVGRLLLGFAIGGFWTMSAAVAMRLVSGPDVPRALSIVFSGVSFATVLATPLGSWLGGEIGWRGVFVVAGLLGAIGFVVQLLTLPRLAPRGNASLGALVDLLGRPGIIAGLATVMVIFTGHFALFTFIRPFLEGDLGANVTWITVFLLAFGLANVLGTTLAGPLIRSSLRRTMALMPLLGGAAGVALSTAQGCSVLTVVLVALWGMAFGGIPVAWSTWTTRIAPDDAESAGGLFVATVQLAIALGAGVGGLVFDAEGGRVTFEVGGMLLLLGGLSVLGLLRKSALAAA